MTTADHATKPLMTSRERRRVLACVLPAMVIPLIGSLVYFVWLGDHPAARVLYAITKAFTVVWPVVAVLAIERRPWSRGPIDWGRHLRALPLGLLTGLLIGGAILAAYRVPTLHAYAAGFADDIRTQLADLGVEGRAGYVAFCVFLAGLHSLIEEFYWRWYVFSSLARLWPIWIAYLLGSLAFAAHHYVVLSTYFSIVGTIAFGTAVGVGGAVWCWQLRRQRTLTGAWLSHALVDAAIFMVGYDILYAR